MFRLDQVLKKLYASMSSKQTEVAIASGQRQTGFSRGMRTDQNCASARDIDLDENNLPTRDRKTKALLIKQLTLPKGGIRKQWNNTLRRT
ncbi:hypothetical protein M513_04252, partial [Trichuris suis]